MRIPKILKIGGHIYNIIQLDNIDNIENTLGQCNPQELEIKLRKKLKSSIKEVVLFHEIFHAINWEMEEKEIEFLAHTFHQVLSDNNLLK